MKNIVEQSFGNKIRLRVCGLCFKQDELLLVKHKGVGAKGILWTPPGGGVEFGESAEEALKREFEEETGLKVAIKEFLFANEVITPPLHAVELFFLVEITSGTLCLGSDPELSKENQVMKAIKFVTFSELKIMDPKTIHNTLHGVTDKKSLLNMHGYFKF
ncbi:NUDIX domain-containing protein [Fulvivirga sediminis]|uniref:NUDIX hydrolase n=1 Tax=Fulvivirga sediminis TaxID=2803949 RepID=A0A937F8G2_9BACT|nr:NUDIX hydrolase [Fulvivirga sediminis]MBL3656205.1 NUDIX hydrolase [Fulvivirga sediminis]